MEKSYDNSHGSPYDRGAADSYYGRAKRPHWYPNGTYTSPEINIGEMSEEEIEAYNAGYEGNEMEGE